MILSLLPAVIQDPQDLMTPIRQGKGIDDRAVDAGGRAE
jgi:hypothetical protein